MHLRTVMLHHMIGGLRAALCIPSMPVCRMSWLSRGSIVQGCDDCVVHLCCMYCAS